jgi:hypothetical protein
MFQLLLLYICCSGSIFAQRKNFSINGTEFVAQTTISKTDFGQKDTILKLYRVENGKLKYLLQHPIYQYSADCNNAFYDTGTWSIQHDSIVFHTDHGQKLTDPIPIESKQIYRVKPDGKLVLVYNKYTFDGDTWMSGYE